MKTNPFPRLCAVLLAMAAFANPARPALAESSLDFVGLLFPRGGAATQIKQGAFAATSFEVYVQVYEPGLTEAAGANKEVQCALHWGRYGAVWGDLAMTWHKQIGNNDEYKATIPRAQMNGLALGRYGFTAYCKKGSSGGQSDLKWKQDSTNIHGQAGDNDIGDGVIVIASAADSSPEKTGGVFVHLFEWRWPDIAKECTHLGQKGYWAVQVSPPMEHVPPAADMGGVSTNDYPWWVRYQAVTHDTTKLLSRSGTLAEFKDMVKACNTAGVGIIVDAVINHTTGVGSGKGTAGSPYTQYKYPQYGPDDFHHCDTSNGDIQSYNDRTQVQTCELVNLADLDTSKPSVQKTLRAYLQNLLNLGVLGFRMDAAKHVAAEDMAAIQNGLTKPGGGAPYIFQELIMRERRAPQGMKIGGAQSQTDVGYPLVLRTRSRV